jgi:hypothetical protein
MHNANSICGLAFHYCFVKWHLLHCSALQIDLKVSLTAIQIYQPWHQCHCLR